jgi:hypothetical protein
LIRASILLLPQLRTILILLRTSPNGLKQLFPSRSISARPGPAAAGFFMEEGLYIDARAN